MRAQHFLHSLLPVFALGVALMAGPARAESFPLVVSNYEKAEPLRATLKLPVPRKPGERLPLVLLFGGFQSAGAVLDLIHTDSRVALASFDYPFAAPRKIRFPECLSALPQAKALFPHTVAGIRSLLAELKQRPDIDPSRITIIGASFGAPFALAAAETDPSIRAVVIVHGFGKIESTAEHLILRSWVPKYGWVARPLAWLTTRALSTYLDLPPPEALAAKLHPGQSVLFVEAERDSFIPREARESLWSALHSSQATATRISMPTDHLMPGADALIQDILSRVTEWLSGIGLVSKIPDQ